MTLRAIWIELFPLRSWPGEAAALDALIVEIRALRLLVETLVEATLDA